MASGAAAPRRAAASAASDRRTATSLSYQHSDDLLSHQQMQVERPAHQRNRTAAGAIDKRCGETRQLGARRAEDPRRRRVAAGCGTRDSNGKGADPASVASSPERAGSGSSVSQRDASRHPARRRDTIRVPPRESCRQTVNRWQEWPDTAETLLSPGMTFTQRASGTDGPAMDAHDEFPASAALTTGGSSPLAGYGQLGNHVRR